MSVIKRGVYPVLTTPYTYSGSIDQLALSREIDYVFEAGAHGITFALVSDVLRLTVNERVAMPYQLVEAAAGRGGVIMSVGAENVDQACVYAEAAENAGVSAIMAIPPTSRFLSEDAIIVYFSQIASSVSIPVVIQDASGYLGRPMSAALQADLHKTFGNRIWFKPEAEPLGQRLSALRDATGDQAIIFEGSGGIALLDAHSRGIHGTMPGCDLLEGVVALWHALDDGDESRAYSLYLPICAIIARQVQGGLDGFIAIERYLLEKQGILPPQTPRAPFIYKLDRETRAGVDQLFAVLRSLL